MDLEDFEAVAYRELRKHGLHDWTFGWANTKRRLGVCKYRLKRIEIAQFYALNNSWEKVGDTLLHEIAHALAGPAARHGPKWKAVAQQIGAIPKASDTSHDTVINPGTWQATCPACRKTFHRYRRPQSLTSYRCRCSARPPLSFQFAGDPSRKPAEIVSIQESAKWEARCAGCQTVHLRLRKPKAGIWRCKCPDGCRIVWRRVSSNRR